MKNRIGWLCLILLLGCITPLKASSNEDLPKWIDVSYADKENNQVSEYQLVTIAVSEHSLWWREQDSEITIDYDPDVLQLINVRLIDSLQRSIPQAGNTVTSDKSNYIVEYQFYLNPNQDVSTVPLSVTKEVKGKTPEVANFEIAANSQTTPTRIEVGNIALDTYVSSYQNDGATITYVEHFEVIDNPKSENFTISLKENNMSVNSSTGYEVKFDSNKAQITTIDQTNYSVIARDNSSFDMTITADVSTLSAKNDRFEFLIYLQSADEFIRLEPTYFDSSVNTSDGSSRVLRYTVIKVIIIIFFVLLSIISLFTHRKKRNK